MRTYIEIKDLTEENNEKIKQLMSIVSDVCETDKQKEAIEELITPLRIKQEILSWVLSDDTDLPF